ncbi:putative dolichyl-diphosphooligosaccharide--protein glycosyltransferase subunit 3B [Nicotiana tabacum]|uniref:Dolichyl-diphosphooligosaccharide--protein glycosyltransferase subunit 3B n=1 Tax=Nicotiana tabacum TaxID=4097 RepID=A0A1S3Z5U5_TOBAC|nr:probable dolichyl-diphosphooligosaccharide--protein glycosyltransferase subunit 3B [Nicotiana tomentosiformis]XP_016459773.1 PREDICTED: probable dolichyl-diphosphooligosaccharide--protein glycosyltransferase subunit 3B [Nicotiana tabacum]
MAISTTPTSFFLIAILVLLVPINHSFSSSSNGGDILSELTDLRSQSPTGVIHLSDQLLRRILTVKTPRPFNFVIFFDAKQLHSKPELSLPTLKNEFNLLSSSFYTNNPENDKLFFFTIEFQESQTSFALFGVNSLPHLRLIPPSAIDLKKDSIQMDGSDLARLAESMAEFVEAKAKINVGPIHRPPMISKKQITGIVALGLVLSPFLVKKIVSGDTIFHDKHVWMAGSIFVYFFSVSGAMHNIIRKMPMFMVDREDPGKLVYFYQGSGMQLGAEGFAVGFLYSIVGLLLAFMIHVLVRLKSRTVQRVVMLFALFVSFWAVKKVIHLDNWKTGYGIHAYWPSSWN